MHTNNPIRIAVFAGGRGSSNLLGHLRRNPQIELTVLVNAYDDGLSTGRLRTFIPGMLGPSDFRKNASTLMPVGERCQRALQTLVEHRLPAQFPRDAARRTLQPLSIPPFDSPDPILAGLVRDLSVSTVTQFSRALAKFLEYEDAQFQQGRRFSFDDCSLGNLIFAGFYLLEDRSFNRTVAAFCALCEVAGNIQNVTTGENLVLTALKADGTFLKNEAEIVSKQSPSPILDLFLLKDYLPDEQLRQVESLPLENKRKYLSERSILPDANTKALEALATTDLIIYGPGTQHSSLMPSYLTKGVAEAIASNRRAPKAFVANILHDHDIRNFSVEDLLRSLEFYLSRKNSIQSSMPEMLTTCLVQHADTDDLNREVSGNYLRYDVGPPHSHRTIASDWESESGKHAGDQLSEQLLRLLPPERRVAPLRHRVSIVVPALNEERSVRRVVEDLCALELPWDGVLKEVIFVDGGSTDRTVDVVRGIPGVRIYTLPKGSGRGEAIRHGFSRARGNVVVLFPSDGEYMVQDLPKVAAPVVSNQFLAVFGSRATKCLHVGDRLQQIYGNDRVGYLLSKYGGMLISIVCMLFYSRYVADPLTSLKAFDRETVDRLDLISRGVDLEGELVAKLAQSQQFILEVPVDYQPRTRAQGKKMRVADGLSVLWALLRFQRGIRRLLAPKYGADSRR